MMDPRTIAALPALAGARPAAVRELAARAVERRFPEGAVLFTAGSPARGLFMLIEGRVRVLRSDGGRERVVHDEGPGGTLGEVPLFAGGGYPATAVALEPTRCAVFSRAALDAALREEPGLAWVFLARLAERVRGLVGRMEPDRGPGVVARVAALALARDPGAGRALDLTPQWRVAEEIGTAREVVVRALRELRGRGALRTAGRGRFVVADRELLRRIAAERAQRGRP